MDPPVQIEGGLSKRIQTIRFQKRWLLAKLTFDTPTNHRSSSRPYFGLFSKPFDLKNQTNPTAPSELPENALSHTQIVKQQKYNIVPGRQQTDPIK